MVNARKKLISRLHESLKESGVKKVEIQKAVGKTKSAVMAWFAGTASPSLEDIEIISKLTGFPVPWFYGGTRGSASRNELIVEINSKILKIQETKSLEAVLKAALWAIENEERQLMEKSEKDQTGPI